MNQRDVVALVHGKNEGNNLKILEPRDVMKLIVIGGCGAWPEPGRACSGYLVEHEGHKLLMDPGYGTFTLMKHAQAEEVSSVLVSHGHPDHCADLNPLLRARALGGKKPERLPLYALSGALEAVLALDRPAMLREAYEVRTIPTSGHLRIGPFDVETQELPHFVPNVGIRLRADGKVIAYTGDTAPSPTVPRLARDADILLAEATFPEEVPTELAEGLCSARQAGEYAAEAGVGELILTHLWPGTDRRAARSSARRSFEGRIEIARPGMTVQLA